MTVRELVKYTKLSMLEVNTLARECGHAVANPDTDTVDMQVVVRAVIADVFVGCYPDRKLEIMTYLRIADEDKFLTRGITDLITALDIAQNEQDSDTNITMLPPLMVGVTDSRFVGLMTGAGTTYEVYDMANGVMCPKSECQWPWMSMVLHIGSLILRDRTFIPQYKNVGLGTFNGQAGLFRLKHPVQADTELKS